MSCNCCFIRLCIVKQSFNNCVWMRILGYQFVIVICLISIFIPSILIYLNWRFIWQTWLCTLEIEDQSLSNFIWLFFINYFMLIFLAIRRLFHFSDNLLSIHLIICIWQYARYLHSPVAISSYHLIIAFISFLYHLSGRKILLHQCIIFERFLI